MHVVGLYTYCRMMHGAYNVKQDVEYDSMNLTIHTFQRHLLTSFPFSFPLRTVSLLIFDCCDKLTISL